MDQNSIADSILVTAIAAGAGILARHLAEKSWEQITDEPAPKKRSNETAEIKQDILWGVASGVVTGLTRMAVRRLAMKVEAKKIKTVARR